MSNNIHRLQFLACLPVSAQYLDQHDSSKRPACRLPSPSPLHPVMVALLDCLPQHAAFLEELSLQLAGLDAQHSVSAEIARFAASAWRLDRSFLDFSALLHDFDSSGGLTPLHEDLASLRGRWEQIHQVICLAYVHGPLSDDLHPLRFSRARWFCCLRSQQ